jgi:hypothetical protein
MRLLDLAAWPYLDDAIRQCQKKLVRRARILPAVTFARMKLWARVAFCCVLAVAQLLTFAHGAMVTHRICPEHGEAVHTAVRGVESPVSAKTTPGLALQAQPIDADGHDHEHCLSMAHGRTKLVMPLPAWGGLIDEPAIAEWSDPAPSLFPGVALLSLAPKGSPPVA